MLTFTHVVTGAVAGSEIQNPAIAFGAGIVLHILLDKIPHLWPNSKKGKAIVMVLDTLISIGTLFFLYFFFKSSPSIFWGGFGGAFVDGVLVLTPLLKTKLGLWHTNRQPHKTELYFLATDILLMITAALWLYLRGAF